MTKLVKLNILRAFWKNIAIAIGNEVWFVNIIIDKDAAAYISKHSKDNSITLYMHAGGGGWCSIQSPIVQLGKPKKAESFDLYGINEISVYIRKGIKVRNDQVHIFLRKFLWIKDLAVDGMRIDY